MVDKEIIREWIIKAEDDFHLAEYLSPKCLDQTPAMAELADDCDLLATFYVETRYPVHWPATFAIEDAEQAYQAASRIRSFIRREMNLCLQFP